jgi:hypothetical protein
MLAELVESPGPWGAREPKARDALRSKPPQFTISTLFLLVTLAAVLLGMHHVAPGLAIAFCVVMAPTLILSLGIVKHRQGRGEATTGSGWVLTILGSLGVVISLLFAVAAAGFIALFVVCLSMMK